MGQPRQIKQQINDISKATEEKKNFFIWGEKEFFLSVFVMKIEDKEPTVPLEQLNNFDILVNTWHMSSESCMNSKCQQNRLI